jgi:hypothetical protein
MHIRKIAQTRKGVYKLAPMLVRQQSSNNAIVNLFTLLAHSATFCKYIAESFD